MTMPLDLFGLDLAGPDVPLQRSADRHVTLQRALREGLSRRAGFRVASVDALPWHACATGELYSRTLAVAAATVPPEQAGTAGEHRQPEEPAPDFRVPAIHGADPAPPVVLELWQGTPVLCRQFALVSLRTLRGLRGEERP